MRRLKKKKKKSSKALHRNEELRCFSEYPRDGVWTSEHHLVRGLPRLHARHERQRPAAVRGHRRRGRELHEEEDFQMGLRAPSMMVFYNNMLCV